MRRPRTWTTSSSCSDSSCSREILAKNCTSSVAVTSPGHAENGRGRHAPDISHSSRRSDHACGVVQLHNMMRLMSFWQARTVFVGVHLVEQLAPKNALI
jgi:hypothetical protein